MRDVARGTLLERDASAVVGRERLPPKKTLQSAYDDYLKRRGAAVDTGENEEMAVLPEPTPRATPVAYRLPLGPRRLHVAEGSFTVDGGLLVPASGNPCAFAVLGVGLLLFAADVEARGALVNIDVTAAADRNYLLHCDIEYVARAWVTATKKFLHEIPVDRLVVPSLELRPPHLFIVACPSRNRREFCSKSTAVDPMPSIVMQNRTRGCR